MSKRATTVTICPKETGTPSVTWTDWLIIPLGEVSSSLASLHSGVRGHGQLKNSISELEETHRCPSHSVSKCFSFFRKLLIANIDVFLSCVANECVCVLKTGVTWLWPEDLSPMPVGKSTTASGKKARQSYFSVLNNVCVQASPT